MKNVPNRGAFPLSAEVLREKYETQTDLEIAAEVGVSGVLVAYYRRKWGIPTKSSRQRAEAASGRTGPSLDDLTASRLSELYVQMGERGIAAMYGVARPAIIRLRRKWGIATITKSDRCTRNDLELTDLQKEVVIGTLMGDSFLSSNGVLSMSHAFHQIDYLRRKHALLAPLSRPIAYEESVTDDGVVCFCFGFYTVQHAWLKELRKSFYPNGTKIFPASVLESLSVRSLAYWYFDDGHRDEGSNLPSIALGPLTDENSLEVARTVSERFGLDAYLPPYCMGTSCKSLCFRASCTDVFYSLIKEFATPDMLHKLPEKFRPVGVTPVGRTYTLESKIPKSLRDRCLGWGSGSSEERDATIREAVQFWTDSGFPYPTPKPEELLVVRDVGFDQVHRDGVLKNRHAGQSSCHAFARHIWEATSFGSPKSPRALFDDPEALGKVIRLGLEDGRLPSASAVRSGLRYLRRSGVYNFRPTVAKVLVDRYCPPGGTVFDPCAGYGGRLFGVTLSESRPRYVACEPQTETFSRLLDLRDWMDTYVPGLAARVGLNNVPAEDFILPGEVDLVLTSPPYWKREVYGTEPTQSSVRYPTYEGWLDGFWRVVLRKSVGALRNGGWVVLNVDDFDLQGSRYHLIEDTCRIMSELGMGEPKEKFQYAMPTGVNLENHEMVLCWRRGGGDSSYELSETDGPSLEVFSRCGNCGKGESKESLVGGLCSNCQPPPPNLTRCKGCRSFFVPSRSDHEFHDENCRVRWSRSQYRVENPAKTSRVFVCRRCTKSWETELPGRFTFCPGCREETEKETLSARRTKACLYRHCGKTYVDSSSQNSMKFCTTECGRREKMFRTGKAKDESYFRVPGGTGERTCTTCHGTFVLGDGESFGRCPKCRSESRDKKCSRCGGGYRDESENNTRRYCDGCRP